MGDRAESSRRIGFQVILFGVFALGLVSCTALPGGSLDPLVPALGLPRAEEGPVQPGREAPVAAGASARRESQPIREVQPPGEPLTRSEWIGRYRDSRGEGEIALTLTQDGSACGGTWRLRTGGSGTFAGTLAADGRLPTKGIEFLIAEEMRAGNVRGEYAAADLTDLTFIEYFARGAR